MSGFTGFTALASETNPVASVPIAFNRGQIMVPARVNGSDPLSFMLDTGFSMTMIRPEIAETLKLRRVGEITIVGIAGEERAPTFEGAKFEIGGAEYHPSRLGGMESTRRRRDGILGSGLFRRYVVIVDAKAHTLSLFAPSNFNYAGDGQIVPLRFRRSTPIIEASINTPDRPSVRGEFEIDTGCDSGVCLGHDFARANKLLDEEQTRSGGKVGVGGGVTTRSGHLPQLQIGALRIDKPDTDFFLEGSPVDGGLAGHVGMEVLRQFRIIFDYSRRQMVLERYAPTK